MQNLKPEKFSDFRAQTEKGSVVPITLTIAADLLTPFGTYLLLRENAKFSFLLESIEGGANLARYSFLGANPQKILRGHNGKTTIEENGVIIELEKNLVESLRETFENKQFAEDYQTAPFAGGAVGFFNFSAVGLFEKSLKNDETEDGFWLFFRTTIAFDHAYQQIKITTLIFTDESENLETLYKNAVAENEKIAQILQNTPQIPASLKIKSAEKIRRIGKRKIFSRRFRASRNIFSPEIVIKPLFHRGLARKLRLRRWRFIALCVR